MRVYTHTHADTPIHTCIHLHKHVHTLTHIKKIIVYCDTQSINNKRKMDMGQQDGSVGKGLATVLAS